MGCKNEETKIAAGCMGGCSFYTVLNTLSPTLKERGLLTANHFCADGQPTNLYDSNQKR
jgi:hypothetical protein